MKNYFKSLAIIAPLSLQPVIAQEETEDPKVGNVNIAILNNSGTEAECKSNMKGVELMSTPEVALSAASHLLNGADEVSLNMICKTPTKEFTSKCSVTPVTPVSGLKDGDMFEMDIKCDSQINEKKLDPTTSPNFT